ncbi:MAG TPA: tripartite tricarboxylate transporter substrate binding protein [Xanthobacteraceae bacterium]|jgi:tripartite-type tricarboxylate transporter receptor subunit TctC|nr:tripartite tricarboxylate transporter substrate binding protein [Xanthobacteraceae bacterium]
MPLQRRKFLRLASAAAIVPATTRIVHAQDYPTRPVRIIEGFGGGSTPDLVARLVGQWLSERLGQPFVVESRTGAGGNIATQVVVSSAPDGYTLLTVVSANAINATLYEKLDFDFIRDIVPVAGLIRLPMVLLVSPSFPATNFSEFVAYAKANPGKINIASPGVGTPMHVAAELLKLQAGIDLVDVAYRGPTAAFTDLFGGQVQAFIITLSTAIGFVRAGKVRALAVTIANRSDVLPEIPAVAEFLPGFEASAWDGFGAPRATPGAVIDKLSANITAGLAEPRLKARIRELGGDTEPMPSAQFKNFIGDEIEKWARVVKFSGAKAN